MFEDALKTSTNTQEICYEKLMTLMLGLSLALGCVAVSFGQDTTTTTTKKEKKKKMSKKKKDTEKKGA